jgi:hypothetical protein
MNTVRSWVQAAGVSVCSLAALTAIAFLAQALVLSRPAHRDLVAGTIMSRLLTYQSVAGRERLNGRVARSSCTQSPFRHGAHPLTESVIFGRERLHGNAAALSRVHVSPLRLVTFMAAACPLPLGEMIGNWLDRRAVDVTASRVRGTAAYELRVGWRRRSLALYVSRRSLRPLLVRVRFGKNVGSNVITSIQSRTSRASTIEAVRPRE